MQSTEEPLLDDDSASANRRRSKVVANYLRKDSAYLNDEGEYLETPGEMGLNVMRRLASNGGVGALGSFHAVDLDNLPDDNLDVAEAKSKFRSKRSLSDWADGETNFVLKHEGKASLAETRTNAALALVGAGVLGLPYAFGRFGLLTSVLLIVISGTTAWTAILIGNLMKEAEPYIQEMNVPAHAVEWPFLGFITFGDSGRAFCSFVFVVELWLALIAYLVANGINLNILLPQYISHTTGIAISGFFAFLLLFPSAKILSYFSVFGILSTISAVGSLVWSASAMPEWGMQEGIVLADVPALPVSLGIIQFCFVAHSAFPSMYREMENPEDFPKAMKGAFIFASLFYVVVGVFAYLVYTSHAQASFMLNLGRDIDLRELPGLSFLYLVATLCFAINLQFSFPIFASALLSFTESSLGIVDKSLFVRTVLKVVFIGATVAVGILLRECMAPIQSLTGCFCATCTCLLLPMGCTLKLCHVSPLKKCAIVVTIVYGIYILVYGTYTNLLDVMKIIGGK